MNRRSLDRGDYETLQARITGYAVLGAVAFAWVYLFITIGERL